MMIKAGVSQGSLADLSLFVARADRDGAAHAHINDEFLAACYFGVADD